MSNAAGMKTVQIYVPDFCIDDRIMSIAAESRKLWSDEACEKRVRLN